MNILIAHVGNIRANEIKVLAQALNKKHNVTIAAMATDVSYRGLAFSLKDEPVRVTPLFYKEVIKNSAWVKTRDVQSVVSNFENIPAFEFYANPADAISIMLSEIMVHKKPDLVICGINNGIHVGQDIYCSSSIGMAMESVFFRVPVITVGVEYKVGGHSEEELKNAVQFIKRNITKFSKLKLPENTFLSISVPTREEYSQIKGVRIAKMSRLTQLSEYEEKLDYKNSKYYWAKKADGTTVDIKKDDCARRWLDRGYITIIPINWNTSCGGAV